MSEPTDSGVEHSEQDRKRLYELIATRQSNWQLCVAIAEYHQAVQDVLNFTRSYLDGGGDALSIPTRWANLDAIRQAKYAAMLAAAGITS